MCKFNEPLLLDTFLIYFYLRSFKSPLRPNYIDYKLFCKTIEEAFYQPCLERSPLVVPLQHLPSSDGPTNFLNFEERTSVSKALEVLAKHYLKSNLKSLFEVTAFLINFNSNKTIFWCMFFL